MEQREVKEPEGTTWTCVQAYAGLGGEAAEEAAELVEKEGQTVPVVCTPDGGAQTVRLQLSKNWINEIPEEELLDMIRSASS